MGTDASPNTSIGHVHLKVADLERAVSFYENTLGLKVMARYGSEAAFLGYGGYHHHVGLNTWHSKGGGPAPSNTTGLFHFAILYATRKDLAGALKRVVESGWNIDGASDHGVSQALYLHDPDGNGIELYWDRPRDEWRYAEGGDVAMVTEPLDVDALLKEAG